jgi:sec-independent protein translocase protein TatA
VLGILGRIGPTELILILVVVLLIFGPAKLPALAKSIGKSVTEFKDGLKGKGTDKEETSSTTEKQN